MIKAQPRTCYRKSQIVSDIFVTMIVPIIAYLNPKMKVRK